MRELTKKLMMAALTIVMALSFLPQGVKAETDTIVEMPITVVEDLNDLTVDIPGKDFVFGAQADIKQIYKFTLEKPGKVKLGVKFGEIGEFIGVKGVLSYNSSGTNVLEEGTYDMSANTADYKDFYLDQGTYYFTFTREQYNEHKFKEGLLTLSIGFEPSNDQTGKTSLEKPCTTTMNKEVNGFFSAIRKDQYYKFTVKDNNQLVTISAMALRHILNDPWSHKVYSVTIMNKDKKSIRSFESNESNIYSLTKIYLNKGTYYVKMTADNSIYQGNTKIKFSSVKKSPITLKVDTKKPTKKVVVTVTTGTPAESIRWVKGSVSQKNMTNNMTWYTYNDDNIIQKKLTIRENGIYTFRFVDKYENFVMKSIKITNIKR